MPQTIAGALFVKGTIGYAITYALVTMAINYGLSALSASLAGKKNQNRAGPGRDVTVRGTTEPMQMIYGEVRTPGFIAYMGTSGDRNQYLHYVVVWAAHQCEAITQVWIDSSAASPSDIDGSITGSPTLYPPGGPAVAYAWHKLGAKNQTADSVLVSAIPDWDSECRGAGLCYTHFRLEYHEGVFANGAPQNFFAYVKGRRLYDPRKDSTNGGSGSHRRDDATTWEHSSNWALCIRDYITGGSRWYDEATPEKRLGFGESDSRIDDSYVISQANICDEAVSIPGGSQARYTCDVQLSCGDTFKENLEILKTAAAGNVTYVNGRYRIYAGAYEAPTVALGPDDFVGAVQVTTHPRKEDVYNMITGVFYNEDEDWQLSTFPNIRNSSYEAEDGEQRVRKIELPATRSSYRAQRIAMLHLAQSRNKIRISASKLSPKALRIAQWQTFSVTLPEFGWDNKVFRCLNWEWDPSSGFPSIVAREESPSAYVDPDVETYAEPHESTVDTPALTLPDTPLSLTATSLKEGIFFRWTMPTPKDSGTIFHLYEYTASTPFSSATRVWSGNSDSMMLERPGQGVRYYWITAELNGRESEEYPVGAGVAGAPYVQGLEETFYDTFEHQDVLRFYDLVDGTPTITYPADGENGGHVLQAAGKAQFESNRNIPYDPNATYLMTVVARMTTAPSDPSKDNFYAGVVGYGADGTTKIQTDGSTSSAAEHYFAAYNFDFGSVPLGEWVTFRGYLSGHSATPSPAPAPDIENPMEMYGSGGTVVKFIRPTFVMNVEGGDGVMQVESIKLEKVVNTSQIAPESATEVVQVDVPLATKSGYTDQDTGSGWALSTRGAYTGATASYTNDTDSTVIVEVSHKGAFSVDSPDPAGVRRYAVCTIEVGATYYGEDLAVGYFSNRYPPDALVKSGSVSVPVPPGETCNAAIIETMEADGGFYPLIPSSTARELSLRLVAIKR